MKNSEAENKLINIIADLYEMDLREQKPEVRTLIERAIGGLVRAKAELDEDEADNSKRNLFNKTTLDEMTDFYSMSPEQQRKCYMGGSLDYSKIE